MLKKFTLVTLTAQILCIILLIKKLTILLDVQFQIQRIPHSQLHAYQIIQKLSNFKTIPFNFTFINKIPLYSFYVIITDNG